MILNNFTNNQYSIPSVRSLKPLADQTMVGSANSMPNINRPVLQPNFPKKLSNNIPPNFIRQAYTSNQSSSHGSLTESFIRSRASFSPSYMHNEITTRYNMISAIPLTLTQIKKTVDKIA